MIFTSIGPGGLFYRSNTPRWSFQPTSGAGAAKVGGRFNAPGVEALYLSQAAAVALGEYRQHDAPMPPSTLCAYHLTLKRVVDFTGGYGPAWAGEWADAYCDFRAIAGAGGKPPSWAHGAAAVAAGASGLLFRSAIVPDGINLVVFTRSLGDGDRVEVHDPKGLLPQNPSSWESPST